jgi:hypothetical protein
VQIRVVGADCFSKLILLASNANRTEIGLQRAQPGHTRCDPQHYTRGPDRQPILDMLMVTIDFSDVKFS